jgi:hypothetical protein
MNLSSQSPPPTDNACRGVGSVRSESPTAPTMHQATVPGASENASADDADLVTLSGGDGLGAGAVPEEGAFPLYLSFRNLLSLVL